MAEQQFTTYKEDITSFELGEAMLGVLEPGRYRGYDTLSSGGAPAGNVIPVHVNHTGSGIQKGSHANPPVLGNQTGVVLSPQGTIIHNDDTDIDVNISDGNGQAGDRYDLIFIEHEYYDVEGANPSIIGVKQGSDGGGVPTLDKPAEQVAVIQVKIINTVTVFGDLQFTILSPAKIGDYEIDTEFDDLLTNIIGDRQYTNEYYITNSNAVTQSLDDLDIALKAEETARIAVAARAIDDAAWGAITDIVEGDVSTSAHGLTPKAPSFTNRDRQFLDDQGVWSSLKDVVSQVDIEPSPASLSDRIINGVTQSGSIDWTAFLPTNFYGGFVILSVYLRYDTVAASAALSLYLWNNSTTVANEKGIKLTVGDPVGVPESEIWRGQILVPVNASKLMYYYLSVINVIESCEFEYLGFIEGKLST